MINNCATTLFSVWKLFPAQYFCNSLDCNKVVHNASITLGLFFFDVADSVFIYTKQTEENTKFSQTGLVCKMLSILISLAYVIYDASTQDAPGTGSLLLVVLACVGEVFLLFLECVIARMSLKARTKETEMS